MSVVDWVLRAYEHDPGIPLAAVLVLGPFMPPAMQRQFRERAKRLPRIAVVTFDAHVELLMEKAVGVVAMAGYNTFCEILSLDKRAILVPRTKPREEQLLRALRAAELGLVRTLDPRGTRDADVMGEALARSRATAAAVLPRRASGCWAASTSSPISWRCTSVAPRRSGRKPRGREPQASADPGEDSPRYSFTDRHQAPDHASRHDLCPASAGHRPSDARPPHRRGACGDRVATCTS